MNVYGIGPQQVGDRLRNRSEIADECLAVLDPSCAGRDQDRHLLPVPLFRDHRQRRRRRQG